MRNRLIRCIRNKWGAAPVYRYDACWLRMREENAEIKRKNKGPIP
jgi:hypothetical protein